MRRLLLGLVGLALGYLAGALLGALTVQLLSSNTHDRSQELAMTALLVTGPLGALIGLIAGVVLGKPSLK